VTKTKFQNPGGLRPPFRLRHPCIIRQRRLNLQTSCPASPVEIQISKRNASERLCPRKTKHPSKTGTRQSTVAACYGTFSSERKPHSKKLPHNTQKILSIKEI